MKAKWCIVEPWYLLRQPLPWYCAKDWIVCPSGVCDDDATIRGFYLSLALDKIPIEFRCVTGLKASKVLSQSAVKRIGDHRHHHIEMDFDQLDSP